MSWMKCVQPLTFSESFPKRTGGHLLLTVRLNLGGFLCLHVFNSAREIVICTLLMCYNAKRKITEVYLFTLKHMREGHGVRSLLCSGSQHRFFKSFFSPRLSRLGDAGFIWVGLPFLRARAFHPPERQAFGIKFVFRHGF